LVLAIEVNFKKRNQFAFLILTFPKWTQRKHQPFIQNLQTWE
jgi:hypothetical protein